MKNLIRILILVIVSVALLTDVANAQLLADRFKEAYITIEIDPEFDNVGGYKCYGRKYYGFNYTDVDDVVSYSSYFQIFIYLGGKEVYFCLDITKPVKFPKYTLPPVLRDEFLDILMEYPVDSVQYVEGTFKPNEYDLLHTLIPDDPNYFIEYYGKIIK